MTTKACKKSGRKHTEVTSKAELNLYKAAYGAKKAHKPVPSYVPESLRKVSTPVLGIHIKETKGKKLPRHVKRKK